MKNKLLSLFLVLAVLMAVVPLGSVSAASPLPYSQEMYDYIVECLSNGIYEMNLSGYNLSESAGGALAQDLFDREPQFFYIDLAFYYSSNNGRITNVRFEYAITDSTERNNAIKLVNDEIDAIVATLPEGLDDLEKALYFYDYLCLNYDYDYDYEIYDVYNMLKYGEGVCQAYTGIYDLLLERVGIKNSTVNTTDHIWNLVYINNNWYHIDATWGDPGYFASAWHDDFLRSDSQFLDSHGEFYSNFSASFTGYDNKSWHDSYHPFGFSNGDTYMLYNDQIVRIDLHSDAMNAVYEFDDIWLIGNYYYGTNSGFGSYKDRLIFNTSKSIMALDPETGKTEVLYTPDLGTGNAIFDLYVNGDTVYYLCGADYNAEDIRSYKLSFDEEPVEDPYDINGDGKFNVFDYLMVKTVYFGKTIATSAQLAKIDINDNGKIDVFDYMAIKSAYLSK